MVMNVWAWYVVGWVDGVGVVTDGADLFVQMGWMWWIGWIGWSFTWIRWHNKYAHMAFFVPTLSK